MHLLQHILLKAKDWPKVVFSKPVR
jgi:hypothetical protein